MPKTQQASCPAQEQFKTMIGGQALIEGIMMRGPDKQATVVRTPQGLEEKIEPLTKKTGVLAWPLIRGVVNFDGSMISGVKCLMWSAEKAGLEDEESTEPPSKFDLWLEKRVGFIFGFFNRSKLFGDTGCCWRNNQSNNCWYT